MFLRERIQQAPVAGGAYDGVAEIIDFSEGSVVDAPSGPAQRVDSYATAVSTPDTDQRHGEDPSLVLSVREAHELSD